MPKQVFGQVEAGGKKYPISRAVKANGFVFISGQMPMNDQGELVGATFAEQVEATLENVKAALALAGADLADVVKVNVFITNKSDFADFNPIYARYFPNDPPVRSTVVTDLAIPAKLEIECIAIDTATR
jgi:2-iminobutanoate/2-iminopropanoate deaminase